MAMQTPGSIMKFNTFSPEDKAYTIKLLAASVIGILWGVFSGVFYLSSSFVSGWLGLGVFLLQAFLLGVYVKSKYKLNKMSLMKAFRHSILMSFFSFVFLWVTVFNFYVN